MRSSSPRLMHIGMGLVCGNKIKDMVRAGFDFKIFLADWHAWINNKLGGDLSNIRLCGQYFKQCFRGLGLHEGEVKFLYASELASSTDYWEKVIRIAKTSSAHRVWRALPIMGRAMDAADIEAAALFYPCMQAADIFQLEVDVACAGMDQRKAHMLARDAAERAGWRKPSCIHTHLLMGLVRHRGRETALRYDEDPRLSIQIEFKMSKSIPESCILVHDPPDDIRSKILGAYCPPKEVFPNPVLELARYVIFPELGILEIERPPKYGGPVSYENYEALEKAYREGLVHPRDLKGGVAEALVKMLEGVRREFEQHPGLLEAIRRIEVTR